MSNPVMRPVSSSNVAAVGYQEADQALFVEFHSGALYRYEGVPRDVYDAFVAASSKGRFVWQRLRDRYSYRRVT